MSTAVEKANFGLTGALAEDTRTGNVYKGVVLKWAEPPDAATPKLAWQFHVFKGDAALKDPIMLNTQSAFLVGRNREIADVPVDHPSCSGQHAVVQFRRVPHKTQRGAFVVKPYLMDLESTNGTLLNGERMAPARYVELRATDVVRFGESTREYVLVHDKAL